MKIKELKKDSRLKKYKNISLSFKDAHKIRLTYEELLRLRRYNNYTVDFLLHYSVMDGHFKEKEESFFTIHLEETFWSEGFWEEEE